MYKLLALDIDGTLINQRLEISGANKSAICAAQRHGIIVTLATGRSYHSAKQYADQLKIKHPLICANGAIIRSGDGKVLGERCLNQNLAAQIIEEMTSLGLFVQAYHRDGIASLGVSSSLWQFMRTFWDFTKNGYWTNIWYNLRQYRLSQVSHYPKLGEEIREGNIRPHKIFATGDSACLVELQQKYRALNLTVEYYGGYNGKMYLELMPPQVSKGAALQELAHHMNVAMEQVVAVGDNLNDLSMVSAAGLGVAMGNSPDELKDIAQHITLSNDEDGVAAVIRDFLLAPDKYGIRTVS
jgi:Cof subfamily protein (haloacid dehalogenase superfamily)